MRNAAARLDVSLGVLGRDAYTINLGRRATVPEVAKRDRVHVTWRKVRPGEPTECQGDPACRDEAWWVAVTTERNKVLAMRRVCKACRRREV